MKSFKIIFVSFLFFNLYSTAGRAQEHSLTVEFPFFLITGTPNNLYLVHLNDLQQVNYMGRDMSPIDSTQVRAQASYTFNIKNMPEGEGLYRVQLGNNPWDFDPGKALYLQLAPNGKTSVSINLLSMYKSNIKGNIANVYLQQAQQMAGMLADSASRLWEMYDDYADPGSPRHSRQLANLSKMKLDKMVEREYPYLQKNIKKFTEANSTAAYVAMELLYFTPFNTDTIFLDEIAASSKNQALKIALLEKRARAVQILKETAFQKNLIGKYMPDIVLRDKSGKQKTLAQLKGKPAMVYVWATWCKPCIEEQNKVLKELYQKYKSKGFEIYSISLDSNKELWKTESAKNSWTWMQVIDYDKSARLNKEFHFVNLPFSILLDKEGKIAALNLRGSDLKEKLEMLISRPVLLDKPVVK